MAKWLIGKAQHRRIHTGVSHKPESTEWTHRTGLGKKLVVLRQRLVKSGVPLLSGEEICSEVRRSRGEDD